MTPVGTFKFNAAFGIADDPGCIAIPENQMRFVMQHVDPDCVVVIDSFDNLGGSF